MVPAFDTDFYTASDHVTVAITTLTVVMAGIVGFPALLLTALARRRIGMVCAAEAIRAEAGADTRALRPGRTIVHGEVLGEPGVPSVSIRIQQFGREYRAKSGLRHKWTEVDRIVDVRPFILRLGSGDSVRVDPPKNVILVDWLGVEARSGAMMDRTRVAELRPHEKVFIEGELVPPVSTAAYRGGDAMFTLSSGRAKRMVISKDPLEKPHLARARGHAIWSVCLALGFLAFHVVVFGSYWRGTMFGTVETVHVIGIRHWTTTKNQRITHYGVVTSLASRATVPDEVSFAAYEEARATRANGDEATLPYVVVPGTDLRWVGLRPTLGLGAFLTAWIALVITPFAYVLWALRQRPWYERSKVVDDGEGPLGSPDHLA